MRVLVCSFETITVYIKQPSRDFVDADIRGLLLDDGRKHKQQRQIMLGLDKRQGGKKKKRSGRA